MMKFVAFCVAVFAGIVILPGIKAVLDEFTSVISDISGVTAFEEAYWGVFPIILLVVIFAGGLYLLLKD